MNDEIPTPTPGKPRLLTGDRPTGKLHLGHYVGSLKNRVGLQRSHETYILIADLHMLTTRPDRASVEQIAENARHLVTDYLSAGIDPETSHIYLQSAVPEVCELNLIFEMLVTVNRLSRLPSLKDMARAAQIADDSMPFGLLGYPVLQSADILLPKADIVPVGKDNEAHVEITREIARRFNHLYGQVFKEPEALVGDVATLMGTDGSGKMSKSLGNCIYLSDDSETVRAKVKKMYTDPKRIRADVPGTVEGNPVFQYLDAFGGDLSGLDDLKTRYRRGTVGDGEVKDVLAECLEKFLAPLRERRTEIEADNGYVDSVMLEGTEVMREVARTTLREVRQAMGLSGAWNKIRRNVEKRTKRLGG